MKKIFFTLAITFIAAAALQAMTFDQFINNLPDIPDAERIEISGDSVTEMAEHGIETVTVITSKNVNDSLKATVKNAIKEIVKTDDMIIVKDNSDNETNYIYLLPENDKLKILVINIDGKELNIVNLIGKKEKLVTGKINNKLIGDML